MWTGVIVPSRPVLSGEMQPYYDWGNGNNAYFGVEGVSDGTSNTALLSERLIGLAANPYNITVASSLAKRSGFYATIDVPLSVIDTGNTQFALRFYQSCRSLPGSTTDTLGASNGAGWSWFFTFPEFSENLSYCHWMTPNLITCDYVSDTNIFGGGWGGVFGAITATSNHPGGVNVGFADGSVRFIKDTVNLPTWWALGSRNLGEVISSGAY
jgi:prepilin-type processing-associated H-X9-DG protein